MLTNIITSIITVALIGVFMRYTTKGTKSNACFENGNSVLRFNPIYEKLGWSGVTVGLIFLLVFIFSNDVTAERYTWLAGAVLFILLSIPLILYRRNAKVLFNDEQIEEHNLFGLKRMLRWENIKTVKFNSITQYLSLSDGTHKVKAHMQTVGFESFIKKAEERLDTKLHDKAMLKLRKVASRYN